MNNHLKLLFAAIIICTVIIILGISQLTGADKSSKEYELKGKISKSKKQTILYKREVEIKASVPTMPRHPPLEFYEKLTQQISQKIREIKDNHIVKLERQYTQSLRSPFKKKPARKPDILNRTVIKMSIKDDEIKIETKAKITDEIKQGLSMNENNFVLFLPHKKVKTGDKWEIDSDIITSVLRFISTRKRMMHHEAMDIGLKQKFDTGEITCELKEVKRLKGKETAVIRMIGRLQGNDYGLTETIALTGTGYFALKKGQFSEVEFEGKIKLEGNQPCSKRRPPSNIEGKGELKLAIRFKL